MGEGRGDVRALAAHFNPNVCVGGWGGGGDTEERKEREGEVEVEVEREREREEDLMQWCRRAKIEQPQCSTGNSVHRFQRKLRG